VKNKFLPYSIFILSFLFSGCLRTYYPAIYQSSAVPMVHETNNNFNEASKYFSADGTFSQGSYENELVRLLRVSYIYVNTKNFSNFNLRPFAYTGLYRVSGLENYDGEKSVFGLGANLGTNINFKISDFKMGIGLDLGFFSEFGGYYNFRSSATEENKIDGETAIIFLSFSVFPVIAIELDETTVLSTQLNIGIPGLLSPSIVLNSDGYAYWLSWIPDMEERNNDWGQRFCIGFMLDINKLNIGL